MNEIENRTIQILNEIIEAVETLSLSDPDSWHQLSREIETVSETLSAGKDRIKAALEMCVAGTEVISQSGISNPLSLVTALYDLLEAAINELLNRDSDRIFPAMEILQDIIQEDKSGNLTDEDISAADMETVQSLDDAAMMLIHLERGDPDGLAGLKNMLSSVSQRQEGQARSNIEAAVAIIRSLEKENGENWEIQISAVSRLLDDAVIRGAQKPDIHPVPSVRSADNKNSSTNDEYLSASQPSTSNSTLPASNTTNSRNGIEDKMENRKLQHPDSKPESKTASEENGQDAVRSFFSEENGSAADGKDYMPKDADLEMLGEFIAESNDLITNAEEALLSLEVNPDDKDSIGTVFRAFHTVKGTSAFLELDLLSEMAHYAESLLSRVRDNEIRYSGGYADLSLKSLDMIKELVHLVEKAIGGAALTKPKGYDELLKTLSNPEGEGISEDFEEESPRVGDILVARGKAKREDVEATISKKIDKPLGEALVQEKVSRLEDVGQALRTQTKLKGANKQHGVEATVRVSTQRLDKLVDMVGEMVIAHSMIAQDQIVSQSQNHALQKKVTQTGKIVRELQDLTMSMRMIPLKATFQKMARLVRDVGRKVGKNVNLVTEGDETEIDRNLVDFINDPLVHMVRNSVDHGIESPEEREKAGKSTTGTVKLSAYHSAGNVVVEISDDGKGLNKDLILKKAIEKNLVEKGKVLTDREIYNLVFEPGFSTAETITDVSGRGVGMDVVRKNIETLRGQVEISSEPGKGSVFKIYLPLTLAIIDGMVIRVATESYVLPTESIVRSIKPEAKDISTVFNEGKVLSMQGKLIPLFKLSDLFNISKKSGNKNDQNLVVIVEDDSTQAGIIIDELIGRQQVVVKSLGESMKGIPGISGGAIMPDGRVGLIIDVGGLIRMVHAGLEKMKEDESGADSDHVLTA